MVSMVDHMVDQNATYLASHSANYVGQENGLVRISIDSYI